MHTLPASTPTPSQRYAKTIEVSKRIRWDIDRDIIRGREFDLTHKFLPDGLSLVDELDFLSAETAALPQPGAGPHLRQHVRPGRALHRRQDARGEQATTGSATRRRSRRSSASPTRSSSTRSCSAASSRWSAARMPPGYRFDVAANDVASFVLGKSTWAVLALTCHIELFSQAHYRASIADAEGLSAAVQGRLPVPLEGGVAARDHRRARVGARGRASSPSDAERDAAVEDLIALVGGVDGILQAQAKADAAYFLAVSKLPAEGAQASQVEAGAAQGLSLAVHRLGHARAALPARARRAGQRPADGAHPGGARAADLRDAGARRRRSSRPRTEANGNGPAEAGPFLCDCRS